MKSRSHVRPTHEARRVTRRSWAWRIGTPAVVLGCGALFVVSATNSEGTDLRPGRYTDLADLVAAEAGQTNALTGQVAQMQAQVNQLAMGLSDSQVKRYQAQIDRLKGPAGLTPEEGPGVQVTLTDAPEQNLVGSPYDPNRYVVHQQDIQAVVNALWKGGAKAVTVQGQRIVTTTGIKCSGSTVTLQGVPYPEPFTIQAVGDPTALQSALDRDTYLSYYRADANNPQVGIGWDDQALSTVKAPAYTGLLDLTYAQPTTG